MNACKAMTRAAVSSCVMFSVLSVAETSRHSTGHVEFAVYCWNTAPVRVRAERAQ